MEKADPGIKKRMELLKDRSKGGKSPLGMVDEKLKGMRGLYALYPPKDHKDFTEEKMPPKICPFEHIEGLDSIRIE